MALSLASLLIKETKATIYAYALQIATDVGLPVSSWQAGDPTRSLYHLESELLAKLEEIVVGYIASGFLDYATGTWLKVLAAQVFGVVVPDATYATTDVTLTNAGGRVDDYEAGDLTFQSSLSGKTYKNTTGGHLGIGGTLTLTVRAEEAGSASSAGAGEIDTLINGPAGVTCTNAAAAVGVDEQGEAVTRQQCRDKLGSLSPNGPKEAYAYVARNADLTGTNAVTKVRVYSDSSTGDVTVILAGPSGGISAPDVALVSAAIGTWATPLCITPTVSSATGVPVPVTYEMWVYKSCNKTTDEVKADVQAALETMLASPVLSPIGGNIIPPAATGDLYLSMIESTIRGVYPQCFRVSMTLPAGDTALANDEVATLGTLTATVHLVADP